MWARCEAVWKEMGNTRERVRFMKCTSHVKMKSYFPTEKRVKIAMNRHADSLARAARRLSTKGHTDEDTVITFNKDLRDGMPKHTRTWSAKFLERLEEMEAYGLHAA